MRIAVIRPQVAEFTHLIEQAALKFHSLEFFDDVRTYLASRTVAHRVLMLEYAGPTPAVIADIQEIRRADPEIALVLIAPEMDTGCPFEFLDAGGDECICLPMGHKEFRARLAALESRLMHNGRPRLLTVGTVSLDTDRYVIDVAGERIEVPPLQFRLLELLMRNVNRTVTREEIMEFIWEKYGYRGDQKPIEYQLAQLRRALSSHPGACTITPVLQIGYRLDSE